MPLVSARDKTTAEYWDTIYGEKKQAAPLPVGASGIGGELPDTPDPEGDGNFVRGLKSGVDGLQATAGGAQALYGSFTDNDDLVKSGMEIYARNMAEAAENQGDVASIKDIDGMASAGKWFAHALGQSVPDLVGGLALGGAGGILAKKAVTKGAKELVENQLTKQAAEDLAKKELEKGSSEYLIKEMGERAVLDAGNKAAIKGSLAGSATYEGTQGAGGSFADILTETGVEAPLTAIGLGVMTGGLGAMPFMQAFDSIFPRGAKKDFQDYIASNIADKPPWFTAAIKDLATVYGINAATEGIQYAMNEDAIVFVNNRYGEGEAKKYAEYLTTADGRWQLADVMAKSVAPATVLGGITVATKKATGQYDQTTDFGDDADSMRTETGRDDKFRAEIIETFRRYEQAENEGARLLDVDLSDPAMFEGNAPLTPEERAEAGLSELVDYDGTDMNIPEPDGSDVNAPNTVELVAEEGGSAPAPAENIQLGENIPTPSPQAPQASQLDIVDDFDPAPEFGERLVPQGDREFGHDHKFDAPMAPAEQPVQDQLVQLAVAANTPEALDPNNTDVVVEAIDADDIERVFGRNDALKIESEAGVNTSLPTIDEAFGSKAPAITNLTAGVMADLSANGVPTAFIDTVSGVYVHKQAEFSSPALTGKGSKGISINEDLLNSAMTDGDALSELGWTMTHEVYHAADYTFGLSSGNPQFDLKISDNAKEPTIVMGDIMEEVFDNWERRSDLGKRFDYPFNDLNEHILDKEKANDGVVTNMRQEVFAQLGALFHSNPKQLQEQAPLAYDYIKNIRDSNLQTAQTAEVTNEITQSTSPADTSQPEGISGEVRAPPESGSVTSVQPDPVGRASEDGAGREPADTGVERSQQETTGERERPDVQESALESSDPDRTPVVLKATNKKPTFKKSENWEDTGNYLVTFADGDRYQVYFDDQESEARESGDEEVYYKSIDGKIPDSDLGETKKETIAAITAHREKLISSGENSYNTPLDPSVGDDTYMKGYNLIIDSAEGKLTLSALRKKFNALDDNQFDNLVERLTDNSDDGFGTPQEAEEKFVIEGDFIANPEAVRQIEEERLTEERFEDDLDDLSFIKKGSEYLLQKSSGPVGEKNTLPVTKITPTTKDPAGEVKRMTDVVAQHPEALSSPEAWLAFERDLTGTNETLAPPYGLIRLYNDIDSWVSLHSSLTPEQLGAADRGLATTKRMKELYATGQATPNATAKLMLWGLLSRRHTASGQEAGFVDLMTGSTAVSDLADKALAGDVSDADVIAWKKQASKLIPDGSFGRSGVSNANDFGRLMQKLADPYDGNISKLQRLHDLMASDLSTREVRHEFQMLVQGSGIDNKVFSFNMLMIGRDDVVILDRIQLNSMWDSERYGKNIYADIADEFSGLRGLARYEAIETSLQNKIKDFYKKLGRPEDASVGRYHWESWVRDSGQIVAHPTMQGLEKDILGEKSPYAFIGAPEGKGDMYRSAAIYGRDDKGTPYYVYPKSNGKMYKFDKDSFAKFLDEISKPKNGIVDKSFRVSKFDKGIPWYESDQVNRQKLDDLVGQYAEREAAQREYASERAVTGSATDGTGLADRRKQVYRSLRSAATPDSGRGANEGSIPRRFRRRAGKHSQVLVAGQKVSGSKRELETSAKAALQEVESFNGTVIELASNKTNAKLFASKIQAGKDASPYGAAVYVYAESDYQNMKMFMTEDGSAGIAVADGDTIVSLFNNGTHKNVTFALASLAVEEGGLYSDAFDTQLPVIYQDVGFRVVSRLKWSDQFSPPDWDKNQFKAFNSGEPDVVFMVAEPDYFGPYSKDVGYYVDDYDEGMRSIRETRRPEQERISPKLKQAVQDRIDRNITAAELNDIFRKEGRYVKPMHPDMIAPLKADSHYINALTITDSGAVDKKTGEKKPRKETYWMAAVLADGERYGSRLDIPSYKDPDKDDRADIVTMHLPKRNGNNVSAGTRLGYYPTVQLRDVLFSSPEKATTKIALGSSKETIATIEGNYVAADHEQNRLDFIAAMDDPAWTQVSMNPERHSFYYDLATQTPVKSASEVIQVGNLVIAKDVVYDDVEEFSYIKKKQVNKETNTLDDGSPSTSQFTYNDEIDLHTYNLRRFKNSKTYKSLVDKYAPMEDFEAQAAEYLGYGRLPAAISPRDQENLMHGKIQEDLNKFNENFVDPIGEMIAKAGVDVNAVDMYLLAKHAPERNEAIAERVKAQREKNIATTEREINRLLDDVGVDHTVALARQREKINSYKTIPLAFEGTGSGMTNEQSQAILNTAEREGTAQDMEAIAGKVYELLQYQRDLMVEYGLLDELSKEDWEARYDFYVPLKGFYDANDPDKFKTGTGTKGFSIVGSESMKAKGRKTMPASPLLNAIEDVQKKIIRARKNEASQTLLDLLSKLGNSRVETLIESGPVDNQSYIIYNNKYRPMMESDPLTMQDMKFMSRDQRVNGDPKYIQVKKGGQTFFIEFKSDTLNASLQNLSVEGVNQANSTIAAVFSGLTRFQTFRRNMLINYNPSWGLINPIRDVQTALMFALAESDKLGSRLNGKGVVKEMTKEYFPSMRALYRFYRDKPAREGNELDKYAAEFHEDGAATGLILMKDQAEQLRIIMGKLNKSPTRDTIKSVGKFVEDFNTTMENAVRLSIYIAARRSGVERDTAATLAKDVTVNFNRKGESTATVNALFLFFNAAVQGNVNIAQAMAATETVTENSDGTKETKKKRVTKARLAAGGLAAMGYVFSLINQFNSEEDDDGELKYQDIPEHSKNRAQLIMLNSKEGASIPLPYGYNFFVNIGRLGAEMQTGVTSTPDAAMALVDNFFLNFVPITHSKGDSIEENLRGFYPDVLEVHQDLMANKNFFGSEIYQRQNIFLIPKSRAYMGRRSTPDVYKNATQFLNDATGGDKYREGSVMGLNTSFNPDKIKYIFEYLAGGLGRDAMKATDLVGKVASGNADEITARSIPILGTFVKETSDYEDRFEFYDNFLFMRQVRARYKEATDTADYEEVARLNNEYKEYGSFFEVFQFGKGKSGYKSIHAQVGKEMSDLAKRRKMEERLNTNDDLRKKNVENLLTKENELIDYYNKAFRKAKELSK